MGNISQDSLWRAGIRGPGENSIYHVRASESRRVVSRHVMLLYVGVAFRCVATRRVVPRRLVMYRSILLSWTIVRDDVEARRNEMRLNVPVHDASTPSRKRRRASQVPTSLVCRSRRQRQRIANRRRTGRSRYHPLSRGIRGAVRSTTICAVKIPRVLAVRRARLLEGRDESRGRDVFLFGICQHVLCCLQLGDSRRGLCRRKVRIP